MLLALPSLAGVVDNNQTQCCSSIAPTLPPATYYGATMFRDDDDRSRWELYVAEPNDPPATADSLLTEIDELEAEVGPTGEALVSPLRDLAAAYNSRNRSRDATAALRRGIHIARVNDGLYTPKQIELVEQLIATHLKERDYASADAQQRYWYRLKSRDLDYTSPELREATLHYADWVRSIYLADVETERFPRLVELHDLYEDAMESVETTHGEYSTELLPYLQEKVEFAYLMTVYPGEKEQAEDSSMAKESLIRFWRISDPAYNFRHGLQAAEKKVEILRRSNAPHGDIAAAELAVADWYQWNRRYARAVQKYKEIWALMDEIDEDNEWRNNFLFQPLELPSDIVFNPGPVPPDTPNQAEIRLRFDVTRHGEAKNIEIMTPKSPETEVAITRAYHYLRNVRFRPRVSSGKVVRAEHIERTYQIRY